MLVLSLMCWDLNFPSMGSSINAHISLYFHLPDWPVCFHTSSTIRPPAACHWPPAMFATFRSLLSQPMKHCLLSLWCLRRAGPSCYVISLEYRYDTSTSCLCCSLTSVSPCHFFAHFAFRVCRQGASEMSPT